MLEDFALDEDFFLHMFQLRIGIQSLHVFVSLCSTEIGGSVSFVNAFPFSSPTLCLHGLLCRTISVFFEALASILEVWSRFRHNLPLVDLESISRLLAYRLENSVPKSAAKITRMASISPAQHATSDFETIGFLPLAFRSNLSLLAQRLFYFQVLFRITVS